MNCYKGELIRKPSHNNKCYKASYQLYETQHTFEIQNLDALWLCRLLTVCIVFPPRTVHFACFVDAQEELVGRVKSP